MHGFFMLVCFLLAPPTFSPSHLTTTKGDTVERHDLYMIFIMFSLVFYMFFTLFSPYMS